MFKLDKALLSKIKSVITQDLLEPYTDIAAKSCGGNCYGNCDDVLKKKP